MSSYSETLRLVQTTDDVSTLRQEIEALRQGLYRTGTGRGSRESTEIPDMSTPLPPMAGSADVSRELEIINKKSYIINHFERSEKPRPNEVRRRDFERVLQTEVRAVVAEALRADLGGWGKGVEEFLEGLEEELANLKGVRLTLAFEPTREMVGNISNIINHFERSEKERLSEAKRSYKSYTKEEEAEGIVLELEVDPTILGGVTIATPEGRFYDLSVAGRLDKALEESREEILGRLKSKIAS